MVSREGYVFELLQMRTRNTRLLWMLVEPATPLNAERVFATFWAEAALLSGQDANSFDTIDISDAARVHEQPV